MADGLFKCVGCGRTGFKDFAKLRDHHATCLKFIAKQDGRSIGPRNDHPTYTNGFKDGKR